MILDLKGKLQDIVPDYFPNLFNADTFSVPVQAANSAFEEAVLALKALGYSDKEIKKSHPNYKKNSFQRINILKSPPTAFKIGDISWTNGSYLVK